MSNQMDERGNIDKIMEMIEMMLRGELDISDFMAVYKMDDELYNDVQKLIPHQAIEDPRHEFWKGCIDRNRLESFHFDVRRMLFSRCGHGETDDDRFEIFRIIEALYLWSNPSFRRKRKNKADPFAELDFELDIAGSYYGGKETELIIKKIAEETKGISPKSARKKEAKRRVEELFRTVGKKKPRWIQEPDWPMGEHTPMQFVEQKKVPDGAQYIFQDADTGTTRVILQYW